MATLALIPFAFLGLIILGYALFWAVVIILTIVDVLRQK